MYKWLNHFSTFSRSCRQVGQCFFHSYTSSLLGLKAHLDRYNIFSTLFCPMPSLSSCISRPSIFNLSGCQPLISLSTFACSIVFLDSSIFCISKISSMFVLSFIGSQGSFPLTKCRWSNTNIHVNYFVVITWKINWFSIHDPYFANHLNSAYGK